MVEMSCEEHDQLAASTQFITHTVGRMLGAMQVRGGRAAVATGWSANCEPRSHPMLRPLHHCQAPHSSRRYLHLGQHKCAYHTYRRLPTLAPHLCPPAPAAASHPHRHARLPVAAQPGGQHRQRLVRPLLRPLHVQPGGWVGGGGGGACIGLTAAHAAKRQACRGSQVGDAGIPCVQRRTCPPLLLPLLCVSRGLQPRAPAAHTHAALAARRTPPSSWTGWRRRLTRSRRACCSRWAAAWGRGELARPCASRWLRRAAPSPQVCQLARWLSVQSHAAASSRPAHRSCTTRCGSRSFMATTTSKGPASCSQTAPAAVTAAAAAARPAAQRQCSPGRHLQRLRRRRRSRPAMAAMAAGRPSRTSSP